MRVIDLPDLELLEATHPDTRKGIPLKICQKIDSVVEDLNPHGLYLGQVYRTSETAAAIRLVLEFAGVEELP